MNSEVFPLYNVSEWRGTRLWGILAMIFMSRLIGKHCIFLHDLQPLQWLPSHHLKGHFGMLFHQLTSCDFDHLFVPLSIQTKHGSHANLLWFDKKHKTIHRFDPHGRTLMHDAQ
jgi:hypothetical protein